MTCESFEDLIKRLDTHGGCIVSSNNCSELEIIDARARGDFYVDNRNFGYVRRLHDWLKKHSRFATMSNGESCEDIAIFKRSIEDENLA